MVKVGDVVETATNKVGQTPRTGTVSAVSGALITVQWDSGEETNLIPGPGSLTVVGTRPNRSAKAQKRTAGKTAGKKATAQKSASTKSGKIRPR